MILYPNKQQQFLRMRIPKISSTEELLPHPPLDQKHDPAMTILATKNWEVMFRHNVLKTKNMLDIFSGRLKKTPNKQIQC